MGFFSRFFKIREQDPDSAETTWAMEDNGSELVLDPEYAATLMTELDLDAAIANHEVWRQQLEDLVHGRSGEVPQAEPICSADRCDLGRWLGGTGRLRLGHYPAFGMLVARHQYFHQQAAGGGRSDACGRPAQGAAPFQHQLPPRVQPGAVAAQGTQARAGALIVNRLLLSIGELLALAV